MHEIRHRAQILHVIPGDGQISDHGAQTVDAHGLIAQRRRGSAFALAAFHPGTLEALLRDGFTQHRASAAVQKMIDFLLRLILVVGGIAGGKTVDQVYATLERRKIGDHGVPVMLGKRSRMFLAMLNEGALMQHDVQPGLIAFPALDWRIFHGRHGCADLILRVPALGVEKDALHHDRFPLAVVKARQAHDARFVDAHGIPAKMPDQLLLYGAKARHLGVSDKPVGMQGFAGLNDHAGRQGKSVYVFLLFLKGCVVHFDELSVDPGNGGVVMPAIIHGKEYPAVHGVVVAQRVFHGGELAAFDGIFCAGKDTVITVFKYAQADLFIRVEQAVQHFLCRDIHYAVTSVSK